MFKKKYNIILELITYVKILINNIQITIIDKNYSYRYFNIFYQKKVLISYFISMKWKNVFTVKDITALFFCKIK